MERGTDLVLVIEPNKPVQDDRYTPACVRGARLRDELDFALLAPLVAEIHRDGLFVVRLLGEPMSHGQAQVFSSGARDERKSRREKGGGEQEGEKAAYNEDH